MISDPLYKYSELMDGFADILLRSVVVQLVDSKKRSVLDQMVDSKKRGKPKTTDQLLFTSLLLNPHSKYNNQKVPQNNIQWDWVNLSIGKGFGLVQFKKRLHKVLINNEIIESTEEEEDLSIMMYSNKDRMTHEMADGINYVPTPHGKDETDYDIMKQIILWHYKVLWGERKVGAQRKIFKFWATSEVIDKLVVQNDHNLVFIGEDKKFKNVIEYLRRLGFITTVICPIGAVPIRKEAKNQIDWEPMKLKETNEDDIIAIKNMFPEVSPN